MDRDAPRVGNGGQTLGAVLKMALMLALMLACGEQYDGGLQGRTQWLGSQGRR
jgi:hypothetical protein